MSETESLSAPEREKLARALNLERLARLFPETFDRAYLDARSLHLQVSPAQAVSDEPAHVFAAEAAAEE